MKNFLRRFRYSIKVLMHIFGKVGIEQQCPCCWYRGRFETTGHPPRYGALCPSCGSLERHRLLILANQKEGFFAGKKVLHFAPEPILSKIIRAGAKNYLSADFMAGRADYVMNIERINQPNESWDVVVCSHVLEHVDDQAALKELNRILKNGSLLLVMAPTIEGWEKTYENSAIKSPEERKYHFGQFDHLRYYGYDIRNRLKKAGFDIREYTANGAETVNYGLLRGDKLFICTKVAKVDRQTD
jgi:SAM-dependent methyltransferase